MGSIPRDSSKLQEPELGARVGEELSRSRRDFPRRPRAGGISHVVLVQEGFLSMHCTMPFGCVLFQTSSGNHNI